MKKYRIKKKIVNEDIMYYIQERDILLYIIPLFWYDLGKVDLKGNINTNYFHTKIEAKNALQDWIQEKNQKLIQYYG